jgi:hypothetical protein
MLQQTAALTSGMSIYLNSNDSNKHRAKKCNAPAQKPKQSEHLKSSAKKLHLLNALRIDLRMLPYLSMKTNPTQLAK